MERNGVANGMLGPALVVSACIGLYGLALLARWIIGG